MSEEFPLPGIRRLERQRPEIRRCLGITLSPDVSLWASTEELCLMLCADNVKAQENRFKEVKRQKFFPASPPPPTQGGRKSGREK